MISTKSKYYKIELHSHLEGTITSATLINLAKNGRENLLPTLDIKELSSILTCKSFKEFEEILSITREFRYKPEDLSIITRNELKHAVKIGVLYAEYRFNFDNSIRKGEDPWDVLFAIRTEMEKAYLENKLKTNLLCGINKGRNITENIKLIQFASEAWDKGLIAGIDLNGPEDIKSAIILADILKPIIVKGCPLIIHAGEWLGPDSINTAIDCGAKRISHGARAIEDISLIEKIIKNNIHLEICITSNVCTNVYNNVKKHPVRNIFDQGVSLSINSDDHGIFNSDIDNEYYLLEKEFHFTSSEIGIVNKNAILSSSLSDSEKKELLSRI